MQRVLRERWKGGGEEGIGSLRDDGYGRDDGLYLRGERRETKDAEGEFVWVGRIRENQRPELRLVRCEREKQRRLRGWWLLPPLAKATPLALRSESKPIFLKKYFKFFLPLDLGVVKMGSIFLKKVFY
jgi:hypothetical protein